MADDITSQVQTRRPGAAIVVDIVDGDLGHAELVEDSLTTRRITVAVARHTLIDIVVVDLSIEEGLDAGLVAEFCVIDLSSWLDEFGHAHAEDVTRLIASNDHCDEC